ncbi:NUDIX domain-containing protein [Crenalkalicoccus roseus]|uniref:NUDIX domain-containing protein n=1 Tax=Crenalkalicoccus roseus TaxID=1485588 RepID=UPI0010811626|nr:NUDIX hydrolase [Crenalkalicoccus roseus]
MDGQHGAEILAVETLSQNWRPLRKYRLAYRRRDGRLQTLEREVYCNGPGAAVLPHDPGRRTVLLIRQYRLPAQLNGDPPRLIEACAGYVEPGEDPEEAIRREAEQELGCGLRDLRRAFTLYTSPGACAEKLHLFLARYDPAGRRGGGGLPQEGEDIEVLELPLEHAWSLVASGGIMDAKTVLLLQHLRLALGEGPCRAGEAEPS